MPNLENKLERWESAVKIIKRLLVSVGGTLMVIGVILITVINNPDLIVEFSTNITTSFVEKIIDKQTDEKMHSVVEEDFQKLLSGKYSEDSAKIYNQIKNVMTHLQSHRINNRRELDAVIQTNDDLKLQVEYQAKVISLLSQALSEQMEKKNDCSFSYHIAHSKGKWKFVLKDAYNTDVLYPIEARGEQCNGYYTSVLTGNRIQLR